MDADPYIGQVLDEKYRLERLLGRGGMGAVYLATHLGTERYVALKLITPQFMRNEEFVARFKREARAAGRLRHPNVVDVTDFGFAHTGTETVAYLVMEYLDGCTLADVLLEEKRLPLDWVVDILEQVCSAVHEAHQQGIVHRDLKPENIWLEPNRLGSYRVKVLDFGIAKLAETELNNDDDPGPSPRAEVMPSSTAASHGIAATSFKGRSTSVPLVAPGRSETRADGDLETLIYSPDNPERPFALDTAATAPALETDDTKTKVFEPSLKNADSEPATLLQELPATAGDDDGTLLFGKTTRQALQDQQTRLRTNTTQSAKLTRVGAIMGTPVYMSPEQCAGQPLDARSDIYSLGVIAYQMLAGEPPFAGVTGNVMQEHINTVPPPLRERNKKVRKRVAEVVMTSLSKQPEDRPPTAAAFASALRGQSEGIGSLYRRAFSLYSEHFPKFLKLSLIAHFPVIVVTFLMVGMTLAEDAVDKLGTVAKVLFVIVLVLLVLLQVVGYFLAAASISGMTAVIVTQLTAAPLRPVELRIAFALLKRRWRPFLKTSLLMTLRILGGLLLFLIPGIIVYFRYTLYAPVVLMEGLEGKAARLRARQMASRSWRTVITIAMLQFLIPVIVKGLLGQITFGMNSSGASKHEINVTRNVYQQLSGLFNIFVLPLMSIVPALLYLKMRQLGGEPLSDALAEIEEADEQRSEWQQRMRTRLSLHTSRSGSKARSQPE